MGGSIMIHESPNRGTQQFPLSSCLIVAHPTRCFHPSLISLAGYGKIFNSSAVLNSFPVVVGIQFFQWEILYLPKIQKRGEGKNKISRGCCRRSVHGMCPCPWSALEHATRHSWRNTLLLLMPASWAHPSSLGLPVTACVDFPRAASLTLFFEIF